MGLSALYRTENSHSRGSCASEPMSRNSGLLKKCGVAYLGVLKRSHQIRQRQLWCMAGCREAGNKEIAWSAPLQAVSPNKPPIVALGKFDALHIGHRSLAIEAALMGGTPWLISFSGMAEVLGWPSRAPIIADCQRAQVLESWTSYCGGITPHYRALPFAEVRSMQPKDFVSLLANDLEVAGVVVGKGYRFGYKQSGNASTLKELGESMGMHVKILDLIGAKVPGFEGHASSSEVRKALQEGKMKRVEAFLGRPYLITAFIKDLKPGRNLSVLKQEFENQVPRFGSYSTEHYLSLSSGKAVRGSSRIDIKEFGVEILDMQVEQNLAGSNSRLDLTFISCHETTPVHR